MPCRSSPCGEPWALSPRIGCIQAASPQMSSSSRDDAVTSSLINTYSDPHDKPKRRGRPAAQDSQRRARKTRQRQVIKVQKREDDLKSNGLQSPVSREIVATVDRANSTPTSSGASTSGYDCQLRVDEGDLNCLLINVPDGISDFGRNPRCLPHCPTVQDS
jgi:hypothetical protein